ncbi:FAD-dependent monooxygenase [Flagellimonas pacifica]|uniref:2-polyprenyl-6-methoxyphenol hydroxylase n=1 Tax=Flagellimonas pacifica TaxID=1247520 RepID=A0A285MX10_9FLAO|nr:FAD-dependent monooxygenase [Allomuricauda parva]SNZ00021.1 2-polyprenyl-6-methoxyphenol hydroxylase [Allomuricauda parva]
MTIDIIGAGIGGLTTAIALEKKGLKVRVFEQSPELKPIGAGIILANNAMQVYSKLELKEVIEQSGNAISSINITNANLKPISKVDLAYFEQKHKVQNIAIHRGKLQQVLADQLRSTKIYLNHKLTDIIQNNGQYQLFFDGKEVSSQVVIGADGLNSVVRQKLFAGNSTRNANQLCWRGIANFDLPKTYTNELNEAWGKADRFGFVQIAPKKVYWYALKTKKASMNEFDNAKIGTYFSNYTPLVKDIIAATQQDQIHTSDIIDLKPTAIWHKDNVCLLGDAAHAATPNMGQGACQAIEDAYVLSECLANGLPNQAFQKFQKVRMNKAHQVVKTSWRLGKLAHLSNPFLIAFRNFAMKMAPKAVNRKQTEQLFTLARI